MSRKKMSNGFISALGKGLGFALAAGAALVVATEIPGLKRYLHIMGLAKSRGKSRSSLVEDRHSATYAQAPRRSGGTDEDRGRERSDAMGNGGRAPLDASKGKQDNVVSVGRA
jgi:hypothetical protein